MRSIPGVTLVLLLAACSSGAGASPVRTTATTSASTARLDCTDPIATLPEPRARYQVVGRALALETARSSRTYLQTNPTGDPVSSTPLFAKTGLLVRTGTRSVVTVPAAWRRRATVEWGNTMRRRATTRLVVPRCPGPGRWIVFPGGYHVVRPTCLPLDVRVGGHTRRVHVGVGTGCRGQRPPVVSPPE